MFRPEIATAVCAYFLQRSPTHELSDLVLMKLMVIAERESMSETTSLITGAEFVSTQNGPALTQVLKMMQGATDYPLWNEHIEIASVGDAESVPDSLVLRAALQVDDYLSRDDICRLGAVWEHYGSETNWDLVRLKREFPEWDSSCSGSNHSSPISLQVIFEKALKEPAGVARERADEIEFFEKVCG